MGMTTRAAIVRGPGRPWEIADLELDEPKAHEVRIRFMAAGLCHSDDHLRTGDMPVRFPMVGGHEGTGIIEAVGPGVSRVAVGDHVVCSFIPVCGVCRYCSTGHQNLCAQATNGSTGKFSDGGFRFHADGEDLGGLCVLGTFSQYAVISEWSCVVIDDDIPFDVAALLGCGVPTGWGSAVYAAGVRPGETVVIYGIGGVGCNAVQGARYAGAKNVIAVDPVPFKLETAKVFGATHTFTDAQAAHDFVVDATRGQLADHSVITMGVLSQDVVGKAIQIVGKTGTVTITSMGKINELAVPVHAGLLVGYERQIHGTLLGSCNPLHDIPMLLGLYRSGDLKLDELITARYPLDEINQAYREMLDGRNIRGVIVHEH
jgi:alcohol dehydrogenase (nicotinoprotein)